MQRNFPFERLSQSQKRPTQNDQHLNNQSRSVTSNLTKSLNMKSLPSSDEDPGTKGSVAREEMKLSRTKEVKKRLDPIMARMMTSLAKIRELEESMGLDVSAQQMNGKDDGSTDKKVPGQSRALLRQSMGMIKKKLMRLQQLEDILDDSESRHLDLQHHYLKASQSDPVVESANARQREKELLNRIDSLEKELAMLNEKLRGGIHKQGGGSNDSSQNEIDAIKKEKDALVNDLVERQSKINQLAITCDDLQCQVEQLTDSCYKLTKDLATQEERGNKLEHDLTEAKSAKAHYDLGRSSPPRTIKPMDSMDGGSTQRTESDSDSSTLEITCTADDSFDQEHTDSPEASMVERLMNKIQTLDRENAELVQSKQSDQDRIQSMLEENALQAARIRELEEKLGLKSSQPEEKKKEESAGGTPSGQGKQGRGYFLKQLLTSDAKQLKQLLDSGSTGNTKTKAKQ